MAFDSIGLTVFLRTFFQERLIRNSPSSSSGQVEFHQVTTDGSGVATIYSNMIRVTGSLCGVHGTTAATIAAVDLDGGVADASTPTLFAYPVKGANSTTYTIMLIGTFGV